MASTIQERFVVLEGLDGSGTTTQMKILEDRLKRSGTPYWATWEPTDGLIGSLIRSILTRATPALPRTIALLYAADRNEHLFAPEGVMERATRGELVISDRYIFSSLAYQSVELGIDYVQALNGHFPLPQILIFLDTPVEVCQRRISRRGSRELFDGLEFQSRVRTAYLSAIERFRESGMRIVTIDGDRPVAAVAEEIWKVLSALPTM